MSWITADKSSQVVQKRVACETHTAAKVALRNQLTFLLSRVLNSFSSFTHPSGWKLSHLSESLAMVSETPREWLSGLASHELCGPEQEIRPVTAYCEQTRVPQIAQNA